MLKSDELQYIEKKIKKFISQVEGQHINLINEFLEDDIDYPGYTEFWLKERIKEIYFLILAYIEAKGLIKLQETFKTQFEKQILESEDLLKDNLYHPESERELVIVNDFRSYLNVFKEFSSFQQQEEEQKKLTSILKNTNYIVRNIGKPVRNEAEIYNKVKWVLNLYYPSCRKKNKAAFIHQFKTYNPDILIPELKTAIEFKYLKSEKDNIDAFIDQIRIDASNYIEDHRFENFIAVIYIQNASVSTPESIELSWKVKKFPSNWELIIVNGTAIISD